MFPFVSSNREQKILFERVCYPWNDSGYVVDGSKNNVTLENQVSRSMRDEVGFARAISGKPTRPRSWVRA